MWWSPNGGYCLLTWAPECKLVIFRTELLMVWSFNTLNTDFKKKKNQRQGKTQLGSTRFTSPSFCVSASLCMYEAPSLQRSGAIMLLGLHSWILFIYLFEKEALDMLLLLQQHCDTSSWTLLFFFAPQSESSLLQNSLGFKRPNTDKEFMTFCCSDHQQLGFWGHFLQSSNWVPSVT